MDKQYNYVQKAENQLSRQKINFVCDDI